MKKRRSKWHVTGKYGTNETDDEWTNRMIVEGKLNETSINDYRARIRDVTQLARYYAWHSRSVYKPNDA